MDKKLVAVFGAASALAIVAAGSVAASTIPNAATLRPAESFAELLDPIPNAANDAGGRESDEQAGGSAGATGADAPPSPPSPPSSLSPPRPSPSPPPPPPKYVS
jgi:hypothetical protein